ncbi:MAG: hypothetical protein ABW224_04300 [Kibdelosporangium sp.]
MPVDWALTCGVSRRSLAHWLLRGGTPMAVGRRPAGLLCPGRLLSPGLLWFGALGLGALRLGRTRQLLGKLLRPWRRGLPARCGGPAGRLRWRLYGLGLTGGPLRCSLLRLRCLAYPGDLRNREVGA